MASSRTSSPADADIDAARLEGVDLLRRRHFEETEFDGGLLLAKSADDLRQAPYNVEGTKPSPNQVRLPPAIRAVAAFTSVTRSSTCCAWIWKKRPASVNLSGRERLSSSSPPSSSSQIADLAADEKA